MYLEAVRAEVTSSGPSPEWRTPVTVRGIAVELIGRAAESRVRISGDDRGALLVATVGNVEYRVRLPVQELLHLQSFLNAMYPGTRP